MQEEKETMTAAKTRNPQMTVGQVAQEHLHLAANNPHLSDLIPFKLWVLMILSQHNYNWMSYHADPAIKVLKVRAITQ